MLKEQTELHIRITGHTDNVGDDEANLILSTERAKAVYTELSSWVLKPAALSYEGKGEKEAIASNDSPEGRAANRRTEFYVINPPSK